MALGGGRSSKAGARYEAYAIVDILVNLLLSARAGDEGWIEVEPPPVTATEDDGIECRWSSNEGGRPQRLQAKMSSPAASWNATSFVNQLLHGVKQAHSQDERFVLVTGSSADDLTWLITSARQQGDLEQFKTQVGHSNMTAMAQQIRAALATAGAEEDSDSVWSYLHALLRNTHVRVQNEEALRHYLPHRLASIQGLIGLPDSLEGLEARLLHSATLCTGKRSTDDIRREVTSGTAAPSSAGDVRDMGEARMLEFERAARDPEYSLGSLVSRALIRDLLDEAERTAGSGVSFEYNVDSDSVLLRLPGKSSAVQASLVKRSDGTFWLYGWESSGVPKQLSVAPPSRDGLQTAVHALLDWAYTALSLAP